MEPYKLPPDPGYCAVIYFVCGPLCALGFFLGGWCGFLLGVLLCILLLGVRSVIQRRTPQNPLRDKKRTHPKDESQSRVTTTVKCTDDQQPEQLF
jgi:hypothetical protein